MTEIGIKHIFRDKKKKFGKDEKRLYIYMEFLGGINFENVRGRYLVPYLIGLQEA